MSVYELMTLKDFHDEIEQEIFVNGRKWILMKYSVEATDESYMHMHLEYGAVKIEEKEDAA